MVLFSKSHFIPALDKIEQLFYNKAEETQNVVWRGGLAANVVTHSGN